MKDLGGQDQHGSNGKLIGFEPMVNTFTSILKLTSLIAKFARCATLLLVITVQLFFCGKSSMLFGNEKAKKYLAWFSMDTSKTSRTPTYI